MDPAQEIASEYKINRLNLLAFPRNNIPHCEITGERANVELVTPFITLYYLNEDLAEQAYQGIIRKIAHLLPPLLHPPPVVGTQEERSRRTSNTTLSKKSLIDFCLSEAATQLSLHRYMYAFPAAIQALKFSKDSEGEKSLSLVEPLLMLSQAVLGMNQLSKAEEYLSLARWIVLNHPHCSDAIQSKLYMLKGRVCTAQGNYVGAKEDYAQAIYFASKVYGAESISTALGFYRLGDVFLAEGDMEPALAYFDKVVDIWYKYLCELQSVGNAEGGGGGGAAGLGGGVVTSPQLTEDNLADGRNHLEAIYEHRKRLLGNGHIASGEAQYTLGLFEFFLLNNEAASEGYIVNALHTYELQLGPNHASTRHVQSMLEVVQQSIQERFEA